MTKQPPTTYLTPHELHRIRRAMRIARVMDTAIRVPGTGIRFGADSVLGLIPGVGDLAGAALGFFIINEARRLGMGNDKLARMAVNLGVDAASGAIPIIGDLFDVYFKSNRRNLAIILDHFGLKEDDMQ